MPDRAPGSAAQERNKVWIQGGVVRHFARLLGYLLLIPVHLIILLFSALIYAVAWMIHHIGFRGWLRKRSFEPVAILSAALLIILAMTLFGPFSPRGTFGQEKTVVVDRGMAVREIADHLAAEEIIPSVNQFLALSRLLGLENRLQAGRYLLPAGSRPLDVIRRLSRGGVNSQMITVPEGLTIRQTAELLQRESGINARRFEALAGDPVIVRSYGIPAESLEGYLFPDTYGLYWGMPAGEVIEVQFSRFRQIYTAEMDRRARQLGLSRHEEWLRRYAKSMIGIHLHDITGCADHKPPGFGDFDFRTIRKYLRRETLKVLEINHIHLPEEILEGVDYLRRAGIE